MELKDLPIPPLRPFLLWIHYMELKGSTGVSGGTGCLGGSRIHYMELKVLGIRRSLLWLLMNPLHGVESNLSPLAVLLAERESITWSWKNLPEPPNVELKAKISRIHYMELKGSQTSRLGCWRSVNPLHGVERQYSYSSSCTAKCSSHESITWSWKCLTLPASGACFPRESITWSWKMMTERGTLRFLAISSTRIHYMELKARHPPLLVLFRRSS